MLDSTVLLEDWSEYLHRGVWRQATNEKAVWWHLCLGLKCGCCCCSVKINFREIKNDGTTRGGWDSV